MKNKNNIKKRITILMTAFLLIFTIASTKSPGLVEAGSICGELGGKISRVSTWDTWVSKPESHKWTASELFKGTTQFSLFYGEAESSLFLANTVGAGTNASSLYNESVGEIIAGIDTRSFFKCASGGLTSTALQSTPLVIAGWASSLSSVMTKQLFNEDMSGTIIKAIGGDGINNTGIIGALTDGLYMPLVLLSVLALAVWVIYTGLFKRKMRESLSGVLWAIFITIVGIALMYNPQMVANIPNDIASITSECVVGAMTGDNCLTSGGSDSFSDTVGYECSVGKNSDMEGKVEGMTCTIWKTFVLDTWAKGQFGIPYNQLYVKSDNMPSGGSIWEGAENLTEAEKNKFCFSLEGAGISKSGVIKTKGKQVCNIGLYHLYLRTPMEDLGNANTSPQVYTNTDGNITYLTKPVKNDVTKEFQGFFDGYDPRMYDIASVLAENDLAMYKSWAGKTFGGNKFSGSMMGMIGALLASGLFAVITLYGLSYKLIATITIMFAPMFFLFSIVPGRGKSIFLGWVETLVSALLKYFASVLIVIVALLLYSAVLANTSGIVGFISVLVLTSALFVYRKEVVNLLGAVNMGGKRMSNALGETVNKVGKTAKDYGSAAVGGAVGAKLAGGKMSSGAWSSVGRQIKRGNNLTANVAKQHSRTKQEFKNQDTKTVDALKQKQHKDEEEVRNEVVNKTNITGTTSELIPLERLAGETDEAYDKRVLMFNLGEGLSEANKLSTTEVDDNNKTPFEIGMNNMYNVAMSNNLNVEEMATAAAVSGNYVGGFELMNKSIIDEGINSNNVQGVNRIIDSKVADELNKNPDNNPKATRDKINKNFEDKLSSSLIASGADAKKVEDVINDFKMQNDSFNKNREVDYTKRHNEDKDIRLLNEVKNDKDDIDPPGGGGGPVITKVDTDKVNTTKKTNPLDKETKVEPTTKVNPLDREAKVEPTTKVNPLDKETKVEPTTKVNPLDKETKVGPTKKSNPLEKDSEVKVKPGNPLEKTKASNEPKVEPQYEQIKFDLGDVASKQNVTKQKPTQRVEQVEQTSKEQKVKKQDNVNKLKDEFENNSNKEEKKFDFIIDEITEGEE